MIDPRRKSVRLLEGRARLRSEEHPRSRDFRRPRAVLRLPFRGSAPVATAIRATGSNRRPRAWIPHHSLVDCLQEGCQSCEKLAQV
jgi:hypothetical protein